MRPTMKHARLLIISLVTLVVIFLIFVATPKMSSFTPSSSSSSSSSTHRANANSLTSTDDGEESDVSSPPSHAATTISVSETIARLSRITALQQCAGKLNKEGGFKFWNYTSSACETLKSIVSFDGTAANVPGLLPDDVSPFEMKCRRPSSSSSSSWLINAFASSSSASKLTPIHNFFSAASLAKISVPLQEAYSTFVFFSSFLFRQYLPWTPQPVSTSESPSDKKRVYRGYHDKSRENLYVLESFCLSPFAGLSGYWGERKVAKAEPYGGRSEARDFARHEEYAVRSFLARGNIRQLAAEPEWFDKRPVVFFPLQPRSRFNMAHQSLRFLSLIGMLAALEKSGDIPPLWWSPETDEKEKPLLVIISPSAAHHQPTTAGKPAAAVEPNVDISKAEELQRVTMLGLLFRILGLPVAAITPQQYSDAYHRALFNLTGHAFVPPSSISGRDGGGASAVCFERGFVWQNCYSCESNPSQLNKNPVDEVESYSFGAFVKLTPVRRQIVREFRRLFFACWPPTRDGGFFDSAAGNKALAKISSSSSSSSYSSPQSPLRVFVDVRTSIRTIRNLGLMLDRLREQLQSLAPRRKLIFSVFELRNSPSRAAYLDALVNSDIQLCIHGGSCIQDVLMVAKAQTSVLVEISPAGFHCEERVGCWWEALVRAIGKSHIEVQLPAPSDWRQELVVSSSLLQRVMEMAVCRHFFLVERKQQPKRTTSPSSSSSSAIPARCLRLRDVEKESAVVHLDRSPLPVGPSGPAELVENAAADFVDDAFIALSSNHGGSNKSSSSPPALTLSTLRSAVIASFKTASETSTTMRLIAKNERSAQFWQAALHAAFTVMPVTEEADLPAGGKSAGVLSVTAKEEDVRIVGWRRQTKRFIIRFDLDGHREPAYMECVSPLLLVACINRTEMEIVKQALMVDARTRKKTDAAWDEIETWSHRNSMPLPADEGEMAGNSRLQSATESPVECLRMAVATQEAVNSFHEQQSKLQNEKRPAF